MFDFIIQNYIITLVLFWVTRRKITHTFDFTKLILFCVWVWENFFLSILKHLKSWLNISKYCTLFFLRRIRAKIEFLFFSLYFLEGLCCSNSFFSNTCIVLKWTFSVLINFLGFGRSISSSSREILNFLLTIGESKFFVLQIYFSVWLGHFKAENARV